MKHKYLGRASLINFSRLFSLCFSSSTLFYSQFARYYSDNSVDLPKLFSKRAKVLLHLAFLFVGNVMGMEQGTPISSWTRVDSQTLGIMRMIYEAAPVIRKKVGASMLFFNHGGIKEVSSMSKCYFSGIAMQGSTAPVRNKFFILTLTKINIFDISNKIERYEYDVSFMLASKKDKLSDFVDHQAAIKRGWTELNDNSLEVAEFTFGSKIFIDEKSHDAKLQLVDGWWKRVNDSLSLRIKIIDTNKKPSLVSESIATIHEQAGMRRFHVKIAAARRRTYFDFGAMDAAVLAPFTSILEF